MIEGRVDRSVDFFDYMQIRTENLEKSQVSVLYVGYGTVVSVLLGSYGIRKQ